MLTWPLLSGKGVHIVKRCIMLGVRDWKPSVGISILKCSFYVFVCSFVWAFVCRHERVGGLPEGKTSFQGLACRYYCYKSDLPHRWEQQIVHTHTHKHTLSQTPLTKGKFYYQSLPYTAPLLQFGLCEFECLVYLVRAWCAYACTCVFMSVFHLFRVHAHAHAHLCTRGCFIRKHVYMCTDLTCLLSWENILPSI